MNTFLFSLKGHLDGPLVTAFHEVDPKDVPSQRGMNGKFYGGTEAILFGMTISARANMATVCVLKSEDIWTAPLLQTYLRSLKPEELKKFIEDCKLTK